MFSKIDIIETDLIPCSGHYKPYYMPYIDGIVTNKHTGKKTLTAKRFIIDTGASITILNSSFHFLFKEEEQTHRINTVKIHYGGNTVELPVYEIKLKIKGIEFDVPAAFDKNMNNLHSLLGHLGFLNELTHIGISKKKRKVTLIK